MLSWDKTCFGNSAFQYKTFSCHVRLNGSRQRPISFPRKEVSDVCNFMHDFGPLRGRGTV